MSTRNFTQTTLLLSTILSISLLLWVATQTSLQQNCTSNLFIETQTPSENGHCPIAYVNLNGKCQSFTTTFNEKKGSTCSSYKDCYFIYMKCTNQKCLPSLRLPGDPCVDDAQCRSNVPLTNMKTMADMFGPRCINGRCQNVKVEKRNDGEECYIDESSKTIYDCKDGSICYQCCKYPLYFNEKPERSKCVPKVKAKKGESCLNSITSDKSTVVNYKYCDTGLYCKTLSDGGQICSEPLAKGANCANSTTECEEGTICRQNSPTDKGMSCQKIAAIGETCVLNTDCAFNPFLVKCYNNKCQRSYGTKLNEVCKKDEECYSGYCSPEGKCAQRSNKPCSTSTDCNGQYCACGGKASSTGLGKCVDPCIGAGVDYLVCQFNQGFAIDGYGGYGSIQYVDEDSSLFTKCRNAYSRYYSCMRKSWIDAGIPTKGEMAGIDLDAYSLYVDPIMPERNGAYQNQIGLILGILMVLVNFIL